MDVSFDDISDEDLNLIWQILRDKTEAAIDQADEDDRDALHLAFMEVIHEQGRRTQAWIDARQVD